MIAYILKRCFLVFLVFIATTFLTFLLLNLAPGDTADIIMRKIFVGDLTYKPSEEEKDFVRDLFDLHDPIYIAYLEWLSNAIRGDFGISYSTGRKVSEEIFTRLPATALLATTSITLAFMISLFLGIISAKSKNRWQDNIVSLYSALFIAMPNFWLGLILIIIFSVNFKLLPISGFSGIESLLMPTLTLSIPISAVLTQLVRASILEEMKKDYVITAKSKGLDENSIIYKHLLKNSMIPVLTITGIQFANLMSGVVVVESIFSWPGIGKMLVDAVDCRDLPVIQGCVAFIVLIFTLTNLAVDISYRILDPRVRL